MTLSLENAVVYDIETFPNAFTFRMRCLNSDFGATWEISHFRDDRRELIQFFNWLCQTQTPMIGFNNIGFDYPVIHHFYNNPNCTVEDLYNKAMAIINGQNGQDRFGHVIWADKRFAPQIDLFKIHHFDNQAKSTGLKALQINMRSPSVVDMPVKVGTILTKDEIDNLLIPYNGHDVDETKRFCIFSMDALNFRVSLVPQFGVDVLNWPDTKIGSRMMEEKLGKELCYEHVDMGGYTKRHTRQTPRSRIALADIIFPYVQFQHPEFQRVLDYLRGQVLTATEIDELTKGEYAGVQTKGVFTGLKATVGGLDFHFGTGGIHGSVNAQRVVATDEWLIRDIDVASLYPSIAIVNRLAPAHLGERFVQVYSQLPAERKKWQKEKGKKCTEANALKLAANGVYGNSNNAFSVFYDPQFTMTITVNGQLMLCMLAERLLTVPTLQIIQINTDGITYLVHRDQEPTAAGLCRDWEKLTALTLEDANYSRMWIRDVNNYIAESKDGSLKLKGAYWSPDPLDYHASVSAAQPPAWHKDLGNVVSIRAAVAAMVHGIPPEQYIRLCTNPYDFMCRIKVKRSDALILKNNHVIKYYYDYRELTKEEYLDFCKAVEDEYARGGSPNAPDFEKHGLKKIITSIDQEQQKNTRYYVSTDGAPLVKTAPPAGPVGAYKRAAKVSESEYVRVMTETGWQWDDRVCTKNKSKYEQRETAIQAGHKVTICNDVENFRFDNVNYEWYVNEAKKLIIV